MQLNRYLKEARSTAGFSLIELLVAMTLGLMLIGGVLTVFVGNKRSSELNSAMSDMQENVRFALNAISSDIRMAGHQGCLDFNGGSINVIANNSPTSDLLQTAVSGSIVQANQTWLPAPDLGAGLQRFSPPDSKPAIAGTHTIAVQFSGPVSSDLRGPLEVAGKPDARGLVDLNGDMGLSEGDLAIISNCEGGELFRVSGVTRNASGDTTLAHSNTQNSRANFEQVYGVPATASQTRVMPFSTHVYYVGDTGSTNKGGDTIRALYQQSMPFNDPTNPPVELVQGVENMQVSFGIGDNSGQLQYVTATDTAYDPAKIRSVRIGLLVASWDQLTESNDTRTYFVAGNALTPTNTDSTASEYKSDKRIRLAFNTTVKVRNRRATTQ